MTSTPAFLVVTTCSTEMNSAQSITLAILSTAIDPVTKMRSTGPIKRGVPCLYECLILLDPYGSKRLAVPYIQANSRRGILINTSISPDLVAFPHYVEGERGICMDKKEIDGQGKENTWPLLLVRGPGGHFYPDPDPDDAPLP